MAIINSVKLNEEWDCRTELDRVSTSNYEHKTRGCSDEVFWEGSERQREKRYKLASRCPLVASTVLWAQGLVIAPTIKWHRNIVSSSNIVVFKSSKLSVCQDGCVRLSSKLLMIDIRFYKSKIGIAEYLMWKLLIGACLFVFAILSYTYQVASRSLSSTYSNNPINDFKTLYLLII